MQLILGHHLVGYVATFPNIWGLLYVFVNIKKIYLISDLDYTCIENYSWWIVVFFICQVT